MRLNRFYLENFLGEHKIELQKGPIFHQIKSVLKMRAGDPISLFNSDIESIYKIEIINNNLIALVWQKNIENKKVINREIVLFQSLIKKDKMEWVLQKAVELGVSSFVPVISERSEKKNINLERLNKISLEAIEQCGRQDLVKINEPLKFKNTLENLQGNSFLGDSSGSDFVKIIRSKKFIKNNFNIFIGPEGGWSPKELSLAKENNLKIVSLNNYTLRSETASLSFLAILTNF